MARIRRILCPLDFSRFSRHAFEQAVTLAREFGADISAVHVYAVAPAGIVVPAAGPVVADPIALSPAVRASLTANVREVMQEVDAAGVTVNTDVIEGDPVGAILDRATAWDADLIVMGTHGRTGLERLVVGSVTEKVLRKASCPVLTVPRRVVTPRSGLRFGRILCPVDFSRASLRAMDYAASFASAGGPGVYLLHVIDLVGEAPGIHGDDVMDPPDFRGELRAEARDRLNAAVPADIRARCPITEMVAMGTPHEEILRVARREGCELIVLGVPSRGTADLLVFGSTTQRVVREAECPVLTIRS